MKNLNYLNDKRVKLFKDIDDLGDEYNGAFRFRVNGSPVLVIASNGDGWEHVSVSHPNRIPSWETMCIIKDMFFEEEEVVMQLHPKKSQYVNFAENCLHLWRPIDTEIPTPPTYMIGPKNI